MLSIKLPMPFRLALLSRRSIDTTRQAGRSQTAGLVGGMRELTAAELKLVSGR